VSIAASLLGCWVPQLDWEDTRLLPPGCQQHWGYWLLPSDSTSAQPRHAGLAREPRKDITHRTPGKSYGQMGPWGGISLGWEHLVLSAARCSSPPSSPGAGDGAHTGGCCWGPGPARPARAVAHHLLNYFLPIPPGIHFLAERLSKVQWQERRRARRGSVQSTHGTPWLCHALHGAPGAAPQQPSAELGAALVQPGLQRAPCRGLTLAFGPSTACSQNPRALKGSGLDVAQCVLPERELPSGPGKREKWSSIFF